jgi:hypothetical protein
MAPDGIAWIVVGRTRRGSAARAARRAGLVVVDRVLMVPPWPATAHLVALAPGALADAGVRHLGLSPRRARLRASLCGARMGRALLARGARGCALVAARPGAPAPLSWLGAIDGGAVAGATASAGPRRDAPVAVVLRFARGSSSPDLAVKIALDADAVERVCAERAALVRLGPVAAAAGAAVPTPRPAQAAGVLAVDALPGRPASALLAGSAAQTDGVLRVVASWLLAWNRSTAVTCRATPALLEQWLLGPAARVAAALPSTARHAECMRQLAARLEGSALVTVAAHNDLTMSNVLLDEGRLSIVDWEAAQADGLPLLDLWYALADGVARGRRVGHARAVELLVSAAPGPLRSLAELPAAHAAEQGISSDQALLAFHACWLRHADDELRRGTPGPFLAAAEAVATLELRRP